MFYTTASKTMTCLRKRETKKEKTMKSFKMHQRFMQLLITAVVLLWSADSFVIAKECRLRIGGRITRSSNRGPIPEPRVQVHLLNEHGERLRTVRTDRDGNYVFDDVCPGTYTVYPGPVLVESENSPLPSLYTPSSTRVRVPPRMNDVISPAHIDFVRNEPPGRKPDDYEQKEDETIKIDESALAGPDLELAKRVKEFLGKDFPCPDASECRLNIQVKGGHVKLSGIVSKKAASQLENIQTTLQGVNGVNLDAVVFSDVTAAPARPGATKKFVTSWVKIKSQ